MIFITIGTQEPFDRLINTMDEVAQLFPDKEFIAQVFGTNYKGRNLKTVNFLEPNEFDRLYNEAELVISHAGMGSIISALTKDKPIVVVPRIAKLGEHRNEHQLATVKKMKQLGFVRTANDMQELKALLIDLLKKDNIQSLHKLGKYASNGLISELREVVSSLAK